MGTSTARHAPYAPPLRACGPIAREAIGDERLNLDYLANSAARVVRSFKRDGQLWHERQCKNCGGVFECLAKSRRGFGDDRCRALHLKRRQARGLYIIDDLLEWRRSRKPEVLTRLCAKVTHMLDQDKRIGRPSW